MLSNQMREFRSEPRQRRRKARHGDGHEKTIVPAIPTEGQFDRA